MAVVRLDQELLLGRSQEARVPPLSFIRAAPHGNDLAIPDDGKSVRCGPQLLEVGEDQQERTPRPYVLSVTESGRAS